MIPPLQMIDLLNEHSPLSGLLRCRSGKEPTPPNTTTGGIAIGAQHPNGMEPFSSERHAANAVSVLSAVSLAISVRAARPLLEDLTSMALVGATVVVPKIGAQRNRFMEMVRAIPEDGGDYVGEVFGCKVWRVYGCTIIVSASSDIYDWYAPSILAFRGPIACSSATIRERHDRYIYQIEDADSDNIHRYSL